MYLTLVTLPFSLALSLGEQCRTEAECSHVSCPENDYVLECEQRQCTCTHSKSIISYWTRLSSIYDQRRSWSVLASVQSDPYILCSPSSHASIPEASVERLWPKSHYTHNGIRSSVLTLSNFVFSIRVKLRLFYQCQTSSFLSVSNFVFSISVKLRLFYQCHTSSFLSVSNFVFSIRVKRQKDGFRVMWITH